MAIVGALLLFGGCSQREEHDVVRITLDQPLTMDTRRNDDAAVAAIMYQLGEGLTVLDENARALPGIAISWQVSSDYMVYTFHLRGDARWSNGAPVTAHDFVRTWTTILSPEFASSRAELLFCIKNARSYNRRQARQNDLGIEALDERTLRVTLDEPRPLFANEVATTIFFPVYSTAWQDNTYFADVAKLVTCGPYSASAYSTGARLDAVPNEYYYDKALVRLRGIQFNFVSDANAQYAMLIGKQTDIAQSYPVEQTLSLIKRGYVHSLVRSGVYALIINCAHGPLGDSRVRQALARALNRHDLTDRITMAGELPLEAIIPYGLPDAAPQADFRVVGGELFKDADYDLARKLLTAAGYPGGKGFPKIVYSYNSSALNKSIAEVVQEMWRKNLGIEVELRNMEWNAHLSAIANGDFDIARLSFTAKFPDPLAMFQDINVENMSNGWSDERFQRLYRAARYEADVHKRIQLTHEAERIFVDDMPLIPLYNVVNAQAINPRVKGIVRNSTVNYYLKHAYMERD